jgi:beta-glucanase (GH16 family)
MHGAGEGLSVLLRFDGAAGSRPDPNAWNIRTGVLDTASEVYTARPENVQVDGAGRLVITARQETFTMGGVTRPYTSARVDTKGKFQVAPGSYVECQVTAPSGLGTWPAFWTVGVAQEVLGWPMGGEIDMFEGSGQWPDTAFRALHTNATGGTTDAPWGWDQPGAQTKYPTTLAASGPHLYGYHADGNGVRFYLDRKVVQTVTRVDFEAGGREWHFGEPQHLILNLAVGSLGGDPAKGTWPQVMTAGYVGVYPPGTNPAALPPY